MAGWLRYWMHRVSEKKGKATLLALPPTFFSHSLHPHTQEPIITWSFIIGGIGESGVRERRWW